MSGPSCLRDFRVRWLVDENRLECCGWDAWAIGGVACRQEKELPTIVLIIRVLRYDRESSGISFGKVPVPQWNPLGRFQVIGVETGEFK